MAKNNRILKPMSQSSTVTPSPPPPKNEGFFSRLVTAVSASFSPNPATPPRIVKVRLINSWQDVNLDRINTIVRNYLHERENETIIKWQEVEKSTGLEREQIVYGLTATLAAALFYGHIIHTLLLFATIIIPTVCSLHVLNSINTGESQAYWLQYWIIFGVFTFLESCSYRLFPNTNLDLLKLILAVLVIYCPFPVIPKIFAFVNKYFVAIRDKFEQYNYQVVA